MKSKLFIIIFFLDLYFIDMFFIPFCLFSETI